MQQHVERTRCGGAGLRRIILALLLVVGIPAIAGAAGAGAESSTLVSVRYRSAEHAYLDKGRAAGIAIGQRFVVLRQGETIATLEVVFVASRSATCVIIEETETIARSDRVVRPSEVAAVTAANGTIPGAASLTPIIAPLPTMASTVPSLQLAERPSRAQQPPSSARVPGSRRQAPRASRSWARSSGTISIAWDGSSAPVTGGRGHDELTGRFDVRLRQIGGQPYDVRIRMRMRQIERKGSTSRIVPSSETRNRMYEISLKHSPADGRFSFVVGRVGISRFVSMGYIDGGLAQFRFSKSLAIGAFGGTVPTVDGIKFGLDSPRYGAFLHLNSVGKTSPHRVDFVLAGIKESYAAGDRKYATVETSYSSPKWTLSQRAEIDFNLPTPQGADGGSGLSGLSLLTTYRVSNFSRIHVSYNSRRDHRPGAVRLNRDVFEDRFRTSIRGGFSVGSARGLSLNFNGSIRYQHGSSEKTYAQGLGLSFRRGRIRVLASGLHYSGPRTNGLVLNARLSARISRAIRISGTYTGLSSKRKDGNTTRSDHRLGGLVWIDLPSGLFLTGGVEVGFGPNLDGTRAQAEAGFRF